MQHGRIKFSCRQPEDQRNRVQSFTVSIPLLCTTLPGRGTNKGMPIKKALHNTSGEKTTVQRCKTILAVSGL